MGEKVLSGIRDWSGDQPRGLGRVGRFFVKSETGREVQWRVQKGLGDPPRGLGLAEGPPKVRNGSGDPLEVRDGFWDIQGGSGRVGGPSRRFGTGREILRKVRSVSRGLPGVWAPCQGSRTGGEDLRKIRHW